MPALSIVGTPALAAVAAYGTLYVLARAAPKKLQTGVVAGGSVAALAALGLALAGSPASSYGASCYAVALAYIGALVMNAMEDSESDRVAAWFNANVRGPGGGAAILAERSTATKALLYGFHALALAHTLLGAYSLTNRDVPVTLSISAAIAVVMFHWFAAARDADSQTYAYNAIAFILMTMNSNDAAKAYAGLKSALAE